MEKPVTILQKRIEEDVNLPLLVPAKLKEPDKLIVEAKDSLDSEPFSKWNISRLIATRGNRLSICVTKENVSRSLRFMDTFIKLVRARGHDIYVQNEKTRVIINDEELIVSFREKTERKIIPGSRWNTTELVPTGILTFRLEDLFHEKMWKDGREPLEKQLSKILAHLEIVTVKIKEREAQWEKEREEQAVKEAEKRRIKRRKELELISLGRLLNDSQRHAVAQQIKDYVNTIETKAQYSNIFSEGVKEWVDWAREKAELIELTSKVDSDENMIKLVLEMGLK